MRRTACSPLRLQLTRLQALDDRCDTALAKIRVWASQFSPEELFADIEMAVAEAQTLTPDERVLLHAELHAALNEWVA